MGDEKGTMGKKPGRGTIHKTAWLVREYLKKHGKKKKRRSKTKKGEKGGGEKEKRMK